MGSVSALGRSLVPWHPATAWALLASLIILITAGRSHGIESGIRGALVALIAWSIVRELAPRRAGPSLLAPVAAVAFAIPADADLLACLAALLAVRIAARSTGAAPTCLDAVLLLALAAWCATRPTSLPIALVLAATVTADGPPRRLRLVGIAMLIAVLVIASVEGTLTIRPEWTMPPTQAVVLLAITALATVWLLIARVPARLRVRDDRGIAPLRGSRIRSARFVALACVLASVAWLGTVGVFVAASVAAGLLATGLGGARQQARLRP